VLFVHRHDRAVQFPQLPGERQLLGLLGGCREHPDGPDHHDVFCLDPHVSAEKVDAEITRLEVEHGIKCRDKIRKIVYDPNYKPGDTDEFAFNKDGKPPTIDHSKNKYAHQVLAKPYPPPS
jgi:hypothetical protein